MPNSPHSINFYRLFDAVVSNITQPLQERLWETWQAGEANPSAAHQIALDITVVATSLNVKKRGLTRGQYAFLGDLFDHASGQDNSGKDLYDYAFRQEKKGGTVEEHKTRICGLTEQEFYRDPPIISLNLLRGYDAIHKTLIAKMYKDLLMKIVTVTLTNVEPPTGQNQELVTEYDTLWNEVVTATRTPVKRLHPDSSPLISDLNKAVLEFVGPAREVIRTVPELSQVDSLKDTEGTIRRSFTNYCAQAVLVDSVVDMRELELFHDLAPTLMFFGHQGSLQNLQEIFKTASKNISPTETPLIVSVLDVYDNSMNTKHGERARSLYFRLANTAFKADLTVSPEEVVWLEQFRDTLYPNGVAEPIEEKPIDVRDKQKVGQVSAEESLDVLNSLIGLELVKQEGAQLVNFMKVQKMRQEKGLPVTTMQRHLVFSGNRGTGKTSVARILANIYRDLGILKKGHLVEVDRADLIGGTPSQTAIKIRDAVSSARGGVLLINEAYSLSHHSHGQESIDALVKALEDHESTMVVILAGAAVTMDGFIGGNSGLNSRFKKFFMFEDYSPEQMLQIYELFCSRAAFQTNPSALHHVRVLFEQLYSKRSSGFGNARDVRHIFESIIGNQANRVIGLPQVNEEILSTITDDDVLPIVRSLEKQHSLQ